MADNDTISFSLVTGASSGIGFELAKVAAEHGSDLLIAADGPEIHAAAEQLRQTGVEVFVVQADLATMDGVDQLHEKFRTWATARRDLRECRQGHRQSIPRPEL
jgi:uncharacterized protein